MPYATLDDMISLFGKDDMLALADREGTGTFDAALVEDALTLASSEVDSYLAARYPVPLPPKAVPLALVEEATATAASTATAATATSSSLPNTRFPAILVAVTGDIARYRLTGGDIRDNAPIRERYQRALQWLERVAEGKVSLPHDYTPPEETGQGVMIGAGQRPWSGSEPFAESVPEASYRPYGFASLQGVTPRECSS